MFGALGGDIIDSLGAHEESAEAVFMGMALELAAGGRGFVSPNPLVGAVLVKGRKVVGSGCHAEFGAPHAEAVALREAGAGAEGSTLYVTLEPCRHYGKTPPCVGAIVEAKVSRVVAACCDVDPQAAGGLRELRAAGVEVEVGLMRREALDLNAPFFKFQTSRRPFVVAKWAMTADGRMATKTGDSRWVSSEESRRLAHELRGTYDGVMVGIGTVLRDDPALTCRVEGMRSPKRIVLDSEARLPLSSRLVKTSGEGEVIVAVRENAPPERAEALRKAGLTVIGCERAASGVDVAGLLEKLAERRITSVLMEGGSEVLGSAFDGELVDMVVAIVSPKIVGSAAAKGPVAGTGAEGMMDAALLRDVRIFGVGEDVVMEGKLGRWEWEIVEKEMEDLCSRA